jgi:hypothetical protein
MYQLLYQLLQALMSAIAWLRQHAPWSVVTLQQEGCGRASYMNIMPEHLCKFIRKVRSSWILSIETSWVSKCAGESLRTPCPHCGDPLDDVIRACNHRLLFCREILHAVDNEWANLVDIIASVQGLNLLKV